VRHWRGKPAITGENWGLKGVGILHKLSLRSGGRYGHSAKLQPQSPQASSAPCVRLLAVPLHGNFRQRFGVPVLASNQIVNDGGHPRFPHTPTRLNARNYILHLIKRVFNSMLLSKKFLPLSKDAKKNGHSNPLHSFYRQSTYDSPAREKE
jgi:hypothetical protein